jgi:hypothetical protein
VHGPAMTPQEAVASVAEHVRRLEARGLARDQAIRLTAAETGVDSKKVRWCTETVFPGSTDRLAHSRRRRRRALAVAAAL